MRAAFSARDCPATIGDIGLTPPPGGQYVYCGMIPRISLGARCTVLLGVAVVASSRAEAAEPKGAAEPPVMRETGEVTIIQDAFDDDDPMDVTVGLEFDYSSKSAKILRETSINEAGLSTGGFTSRRMNVAQYSESISRLTPRIEIGLYQDIAAHLTLPILLSHSSSLEDLEGSAGKAGVVAQGQPGETLFSIPFRAPDRSGLEYLGAGLDFGIWNQARDRTKPTWTFGVEGRFPVSEAMHACTTAPKAGQVECAGVGDINRNGSSDSDFEGSVAKREAGVSRGTIALEGHTMFSRRIKYVEPYAGLSALFEIPMSSSDFNLVDLEGSIVNHPPLVGTMTFGLLVIPWENRSRFSRVTIDFRFTGEYHSEGRDYSELFDALGSSDAASLRQPLYAKYKTNPNYKQGCTGANCEPQSVVDDGSQRVFFTGLTDVQPYGTFRGSGGITWQASDVVKFKVGAGVTKVQGHVISGDQPCNPDLKGEPGASGPCKREEATSTTVTGAPNPSYRPSVNAPGRRFFVDDATVWDVFASAVVMF